ncbi:hypothetical protein T492DRAFT_835656 [Pavlovales sp. CCMP2436]|nr:hypothetical protein T492DRAFT_835656 [Pavlovales sp. CCMP2436]
MHYNTFNLITGRRAATVNPASTCSTSVDYSFLRLLGGTLLHLLPIGGGYGGRFCREDLRPTRLRPAAGLEAPRAIRVPASGAPDSENSGDRGGSPAVRVRVRALRRGGDE